MTHTEGGHEAELEPHQRAERVTLASQRAEGAHRKAQDAQRSAADSLEKSAESQERMARSYEEAAERDDSRQDEFRAHAASHSKYAREDHRIAQQLRQMAE